MLINSVQEGILGGGNSAEETWWLQLQWEYGLCFMLREMSERTRGLGSWVIALICCLTPDTKAQPRFITHGKRGEEKTSGRIKGKKKNLTPPPSTVRQAVLTFCQTCVTTLLFSRNYKKKMFYFAYNIQKTKIQSNHLGPKTCRAVQRILSKASGRKIRVGHKQAARESLA